MLGEGFTPEDEEDSATATVTATWVYQARYRVPLAKAAAGAGGGACSWMPAGLWRLMGRLQAGMPSACCLAAVCCIECILHGICRSADWSCAAWMSRCIHHWGAPACAA